MGMLLGLVGLVLGLLVGIIGAIVGWRLTKGSNWKFATIPLGFVLGAVLGFLLGFGAMWLMVADQLG